MRLLSRDEITKAKANDRQKEIAEGLKLTQKVDSLRELMAKEEEKMEKFRRETLIGIKKEIGELNERKKEIESDVKELENIKKRGTKEIDNEKKSIKILQSELEDKLEKTLKKEQELKIKEKNIDVLFKQSSDEIKRVQTHTREAQNERIALKAKLEAVQNLQQSLVQSGEIFDEEKKVFEISMKQRDLVIQERESLCSKKEKELSDLSRELAIQKIQVEDQRKTLERAFARLKK